MVLNNIFLQARAALQWLRETADVGRELASIRASVTARASLHHCRRRRFEQGWAPFAPLARPIFVTCGLMFFQRFSGVSSFNSYAVSIFGKTFGELSPHGGAVAVAFVQLLASMLSGLLVDSVGRLPLLIASSVIVSMALAAFGSYTYYQVSDHGENIHLQQFGRRNSAFPKIYQFSK